MWTTYKPTELEAAMSKSSRSSIEAVADALTDAKGEAGAVWDRTFEIATPKRSKRKGKAIQ